jgi:hypothetical protein
MAQAIQIFHSLSSETKSKSDPRLINCYIRALTSNMEDLCLLMLEHGVINDVNAAPRPNLPNYFLLNVLMGYERSVRAMYRVFLLLLILILF